MSDNQNQPKNVHSLVVKSDNSSTNSLESSNDNRLLDFQASRIATLTDERDVLNTELNKLKELHRSTTRELQELSKTIERQRKSLANYAQDLEKCTLERDELRSHNRNLQLIYTSVTFRLSRVLSDSVSSPSGFINAPFRLVKIVKEGIHLKLRKIGHLLSPARFPLRPSEVELLLIDLYNTQGLPAVEAFSKEAIHRGAVNEEMLHRILYDLLKRKEPEAALTHAQLALQLNPKNTKLKNALLILLEKWFSRGILAPAIELYNFLQSVHIDDKCTKFMDPYVELANEGLKFRFKKNHSQGEPGHYLPDVREVTDYLETLTQREGVAGLERLLAKISPLGKREEAAFLRLFFQITKDVHKEFAHKLGWKAFQIEPDPSFAASLKKFCFQQGKLRDALQLSEYIFNLTGDESKVVGVRGLVKLLDNGFEYPEYSEHLAYTPSKDPHTFYLLHNSLPHNSGGYATRSHGILTGIRKAGTNIRAVSRLGYPHDREGYEEAPTETCHIIDEVEYHHLINLAEGLGSKPMPDYLQSYATALEQLVLLHQPSVIHAASNFMNGVAANFVGAKFGIPTVYEVRGLWEITRMSRVPEWEDSDYFQLQSRMERDVCLQANHVVAITEALKREMVSRGVPEEKISVIPNGADSARFKPLEKDVELANNLSIPNNTPVIGYVGSIVGYEGLDYLIIACKKLKELGSDFRLLVVGDGAALDELITLAHQLELDDRVIFTGRVPHHDVESYYSLIDIAPYPRRGLPVCEMVSPMKPFEAMCMEKAVLASNVDALSEIVQDGKTGLLHTKDDPADLANKLQILISNPDLRKDLGSHARKWVVAERDWNYLASQFVGIYQTIINETSQDSRGRALNT